MTTPFTRTGDLIADCVRNARSCRRPHMTSFMTHSPIGGAAISAALTPRRYRLYNGIHDVEVAYGQIQRSKTTAKCQEATSCGRAARTSGAPTAAGIARTAYSSWVNRVVAYAPNMRPNIYRGSLMVTNLYALGRQGCSPLAPIGWNGNLTKLGWIGLFAFILTLST